MVATDHLLTELVVVNMWTCACVGVHMVLDFVNQSIIRIHFMCSFTDLVQ